MLVVGFPAGSFATNCYLVAPAAGERCLIVDPGQDAVAGIAEMIREHHLKPAAVLLTHGHIDHVWSVVPVCGAHDIPAYVHGADRARVGDPLATMPADWVAAMGLAGVRFGEPDDLREIADGEQLDLAGVALRVDHAPGHTAGSVAFVSADGGADSGPDGGPLMFAGDLLFAGSIGRTDLVGGDSAAMQRSLARVVLGAPDETVVLPGHGPQTTIGRERATNPYLRGLAGAAAGVRPRQGRA